MDITPDSLSNISLNDTTISFNISVENVLEQSQSDRENVIQQLLKLYLRHNLTKVAVADIAKVLNAVPGAKVQIPTTTYLLFNEFLTNSSHKVHKFVQCQNCKEYNEIPFNVCSEFKCEYCNNEAKSIDIYFIHLQIESQLRSIIKNNFSEILAFKRKNEEKTDSKIEDVYDGKVVRELWRAKYVYTLTINTDGLIVHNSSRSSLYPILMTCNFLPPNIRFKETNMIIAGLYYNSKKPDFMQYLHPIIRKFENIRENGFFERQQNFQFFVTHAAFDLPIKSMLQQIKQYNGFNACYYCEHPGESTEKGVRYTSGYRNPPRTHSNLILTMKEVLKTNKPINGIKGISPMVGFPSFDLVRSMSIDYMHGVLLGVLKNMFTFWLDSKNKKQPFYINSKQKVILNQRIVKIKPCRFVNRRIFALEKYKQFKASQFRSFLLYFYPVLNGILKKKYFDHFRLLSSSLYTLLGEEISTDALKQVEFDLNRFVNEYEIIYGKINMTMNVHCLVHLTECVKNLGPLWSYSMFSFESFNGTLRNYGSKSTNVINQVLEKIIIGTSASENSSKLKCATDLLQDKINNNSSPIDLSALHQANISGHLTLYASLKRGLAKFTSLQYTLAKKTNDYFVQTSKNVYGKVKCYVQSDDATYFLLMEYIALDRSIDQFSIVKAKGTITVKPTHEIADKCIYMLIDSNEYIVKRPNKFEVN